MAAYYWLALVFCVSISGSERSLGRGGVTMTNLVGDYICYREGGLDEEKFKEILQSNIRKCAFIDESSWETVLRTPEEFRRIGVDYGSFGMKAKLIKLK